MRPVRPQLHSGTYPTASIRGVADGSGLRGSRTYNVHRGSRSSLQSPAPVALPVRPPPERETRQGIGLLMPVYLAPLIIYGTRRSRCLYSVMLPLCWWLTSSVPRCVAAFSPILALPVLHIMEAEETAASFFEVKSLEVTALLAFLTAALSTSDLVPRISFKLCSSIGFQIRSLFVGLACLTYVLTTFMHQSVVGTLLVLVVDKVLSCVHETELDKTFTERLEKRVSLEWLSLPNPLVAYRKSSLEAADADKLFDKLAQAVVNLNDSVAESGRGSLRESIQEGRTEEWEIEPNGVPGGRKITTMARNVTRSPSYRSPRPINRPVNIAASTRTVFGHRGAALRGESQTQQRREKPNHGFRSPPNKLQDRGALNPLSIPSARLSPPPKFPLITDKPKVGSPDVSPKDIPKGAAEPKNPPPATSKAAKAATSKTDVRVLKSGLKSPGTTSPKRNAEKGKGKSRKKTASKKSATKKPPADGSVPPESKKPAALSGGAKDGASTLSDKNALVTNSLPGIQSPTAKEKKKRRARIEHAETVVINVAPKQLPLQGNASPDEYIARSPASPASNLASPTLGSPNSQLGFDIRRPSILKVPGAPRSKAPASPSVGGEASVLPTGFVRRHSTVDFGPLECHVLPDVQDYSSEVAIREEWPWVSASPEAPERCYSPEFQSPITSGLPSRSATPRPNTAADSSLLPRPSSSVSASSPHAGASCAGQARRRLSIASPAERRAPASTLHMSPRRLLGYAGTNHSGDDKDGSRQRRAHQSMRTAFVLCSSLVSVTGSLCSAITISAKEALLTHDIVKPGPQGLLRWLLLNTPTALLSTITCCVPLYYLHLKSRDVVQSERELRDVQVAATARLKRLGPVRNADFLLVYGIISYLLFMIMGQIFHYNTRENLVVFASFVLLLSSAAPQSVRQMWSPQQRVICWSSVARDMPWPVVFIQSAVQLISRVVERNNLLEAGFATIGPEFWAANSRLTNQMLFGVVGSVLAEMDENESLGLLLMPLVLDVARDTRVAPGAYAVPVALGASSNMILPIRLPLIVAHEVIDVPMTQLILIGVLVKSVMLITSIISVNTFGEYLISLEPPEVNATFSGNDTSLEFDV